MFIQRGIEKSIERLRRLRNGEPVFRVYGMEETKLEPRIAAELIWLWISEDRGLVAEAYLELLDKLK